MSISDLVKNTLEELQDLMISKTVVGEPIEAAGHTLVPVSKVMFGFGGGGGEGGTDKTGTGTGQGIGGGWSIEPVAFVVLGKDGAKLLTIGEKESAVTRLMDMAPKVVDTVKDMVDKKTAEKAEDKSEEEEDK